MRIKKAVIPAAGLGTRMLPATKSIPKEMLPLGDKPSIQYIVEEAVASGIEDILIITNRMKTAMEDYFDYYPELEKRLIASGNTKDAQLIRETADMANVLYLRQKETLGLGHAVWCARRFVGDEPFAVLLGDDIMLSEKPVTLQLAEAYEKYGCGMVGVQRVSLDVIGKYCSLKAKTIEGNVMKVSDIIEKPKPYEVFSDYAILGRYVLTSDIFDILENQSPGYGGEIQLTDAL
ncbi:MAG: UTP--glucose-1-phosphate uridylyltransferase, partial [Clostridiales bacterium]|nr:UTP--glucose-1-phosphate uridylyltransferase [Clostridiales bacterium]